MYVNFGDTIQLWCYGYYGDGNSYAYNAGISATLINSAANGVHKSKMKRVAPPPPGPAQGR